VARRRRRCHEPTDLTIAIGHKASRGSRVDVLAKPRTAAGPPTAWTRSCSLGRVLTQLEARDRELQARTPHARMGTASLHASFVEGGHD
jgi:hypothetical protein